MDHANTKRRQIIAACSSLVAFGLVPRTIMAQSSENVFRIGALNPITGAGGLYGPGMQKIIVAVANQINEAGGAGGKKIEVIAEDCQTKPEAAAMAVKKLLEVNKVKAILGTWSSGVTLVALSQANLANAIVMNTSGASNISAQNTKGLCWRFQATNERYGKAFYEASKLEGFKKIATMGLNNPAALSITHGFTDALKADGGTLTGSVVYEPNRPGYRSEVRSVLSGKPDAVVLGAYLPDATVVLREWYQTGQATRWLIPGFVGAEKLIDALGPEVTDGILVIDIVSNTGSKSFDKFNALYQQVTGNSGSEIYAAMCYDMMMVLGLALEAAGAGASIELINGKIREVSSPGGTLVSDFAEGKAALKQGRITYEGASSKLDFDERGDAAQDLSIAIIEKGRLNPKGRVTV